MEAGPYQSLSVPATLKVSEVSLTWAIKDVYFTKKKKKKTVYVMGTQPAHFCGMTITVHLCFASESKRTGEKLK